jgi:hypothetical protein
MRTRAPAEIQHAASLTAMSDKLQKYHGTVSTIHMNPSPWQALLTFPSPTPPPKKVRKFSKNLLATSKV